MDQREKIKKRIKEIEDRAVNSVDEFLLNEKELNQLLDQLSVLDNDL